MNGTNAASRNACTSEQNVNISLLLFPVFQVIWAIVYTIVSVYALLFLFHFGLVAGQDWLTWPAAVCAFILTGLFFLDSFPC